MRIRSNGACAFFVLWAAACGSDTTDPDEPDTGPDTPTADLATVEIGTGFVSFVPVLEGQALDIIEGIQGGYHLFGGFRVEGLAQRNLTIDFDIEWNGESVGGASYVDDLIGGTSPFEYSGVAVIFDDNDVPPEVSGNPVTLSVTLRDSEGVTVSDSVEVIPRCCSF
jgi:hypothetical protein